MAQIIWWRSIAFYCSPCIWNGRKHNFPNSSNKMNGNSVIASWLELDAVLDQNVSEVLKVKALLYWHVWLFATHLFFDHSDLFLHLWRNVSQVLKVGLLDGRGTILPSGEMLWLNRVDGDVCGHLYWDNYYNFCFKMIIFN